MQAARRAGSGVDFGAGGSKTGVNFIAYRTLFDPNAPRAIALTANMPIA
jgi:hypothetical protein